MGQGLQVFDASGTLMLDTSDRVAKVLGVIGISGNGSVTVPLLVGNNPFFSIVPTNSSVAGATAGMLPNVTYNATSGLISWSFTTTAFPCNLIYGMY